MMANLWHPCRNNLEYESKIMAFICTLTRQQVPFFAFSVSQASEQWEHARKSAFLTWTSCTVPHPPSQTFTVITFPWFLLCDSCLVNAAAEIHYLIFSLLSFPFRWVSVNNMWIIPVSCELLLSPSALPFPCTSLYDSAIRFEKTAPFSLWFAVILIKEKKQCAQRDELHAERHRGGLCSGCC